MSQLNMFLCNVIDEALTTFDDDKGLYTFDDDHQDEEDSSNSTIAGDDLLPFYDVSDDTTAATPVSTTTTASTSRARKEAPKKRKQQSNDNSMVKPRRPLSAYNIFFRYERDSIVSGKDPDRILMMSTVSVEDKIAHIREITMNALALETTKKKRRTSRKTHDQISFGDLAKMIAEKWKKVKPEHRSLFEQLSTRDKNRYKKELQDWNEKRMNKNKKSSSSNASPSLPKQGQKKRDAAIGPPSSSSSQPNKKNASSIPRNSNMPPASTSCLHKSALSVVTPLCPQQDPLPCCPPYVQNNNVPDCTSYERMPVPWNYQPTAQKNSPKMHPSHSFESLDNWFAPSFHASPNSVADTFHLNDDLPMRDEFESFMVAFESE